MCRHSALSSLNLPAALEDQSGQKVPQSVLDKAQQVQQLGGMAHIDSLIDGLPDLLLRNRETLDEVLLILVVPEYTVDVCVCVCV